MQQNMTWVHVLILLSSQKLIKTSISSQIDSDLNSSMASSRGSSPFLPPAMPLLEVKSQVYNEAAVDVPADFENVASSPSDESLHGG